MFKRGPEIHEAFTSYYYWKGTNKGLTELFSLVASETFKQLNFYIAPAGF